LSVRFVKEGGSMLMSSVRNWFGGATAQAAAPLVRAPAPAAVFEPEPNAPPPLASAPEPEGVWPPARITVAESLWGEGFLFPGGEDETLRLVKPLGLSPKASLLLLGAGSGGPARAIAAKLGVWVTAFEADPDLAVLSMERSTKAGLGRRAQTEM
jgi:hypothetical protein